MTDIRECPCCFAKAKFVDTVRVLKKLTRIGYIRCNGCGLRTGTSTYGRAVKVWNRRVTMEVRHE
jgi:transcription elongation factor Elf1